VLLRKPRSQVEIYNDLWLEVVNFFRVLRDRAQCAELLRLVALTPFSRAEHEAARQPAPGDLVESARRLLIRSFMGHGSHGQNPANTNGFRTRDHDARKSYAREWAGIPDNLATIAQRFVGVTIEQLAALDVIAKYDSAQALFYVDPPYIAATRNGGGNVYHDEMTDRDHHLLARALRSVKGKVILSGYDGHLYRELYADWRRLEKRVTANGQKGAVPRTECLWMNFDPQKKPDFEQKQTEITEKTNSSVSSVTSCKTPPPDFAPEGAAAPACDKVPLPHQNALYPLAARREGPNFAYGVAAPLP